MVISTIALMKLNSNNLHQFKLVRDSEQPHSAAGFRNIRQIARWQSLRELGVMGLKLRSP